MKHLDDLFAEDFIAWSGLVLEFQDLIWLKKKTLISKISTQQQVCVHKSSPQWALMLMMRLVAVLWEKGGEWNVSSVFCFGGQLQPLHLGNHCLQLYNVILSFGLLWLHRKGRLIWCVITSSEKDQALSLWRPETKYGNYLWELKCQGGFRISSSRNWISDILP